MLYGEPVYPPPPARVFVAGFDLRCWRAPEPRQEVLRELDIADRATQLELAEIQVLLYDDPAAAVTRLQTFLGPAYSISMEPNRFLDLTPGSLIAVSDRQTVVIVSGTTTPQQLALQFARGVPPINVGQFSTHATHWNASNDIEERIQRAGALADKPITFVGHSYGGAVAIILATRYRFADTGQPIRLLTYAAPQSLDHRGQAILADVPQIHLANAGDPVPALPPHSADLFPFLPLAGPVLATIWTQLEPLDHQWVLSADGKLIESNVPTYTYGQLWKDLVEIISGGTLAPIDAHRIGTYRDRLALTPP